MKKQPMGPWRGVVQKLRGILLDCGLEEVQKWGKPCFVLNGKNVAIIQPFKEFCSLMFFKGAMLNGIAQSWDIEAPPPPSREAAPSYRSIPKITKGHLEDTHGQLRSQGENTQSAMRLEFTTESQVKKTIVTSYTKQAIKVERDGLKVKFSAKDEMELPKELSQVIDTEPKLAKAFRGLTPGRQRGYVLHITAAKQSKTRTARVEKCIPNILACKGLNGR